VKRALCIIGALAGGLGFSQIPEYSQQYAQRLGGAVDELAAITAEFDAAARAAGITREEALTRYETTGDTFIAGRGETMRAIFVREARMTEQLVALQTADPLERIMSMTRHFDTEVGGRALETYQPAVPVTGEGVAHAGAGALAGYGVLWALLSLLMAPFRRSRNRIVRAR
jgi:hypothetical protein